MQTLYLCLALLQLWLLPPLFGQQVNAIPEGALPLAVVNQIITAAMKEKSIPGVAVALYIGDKSAIVCYGVANKEKVIAVTPDTIFEIASLTKIFTATDLALQVDKGKMSLVAPLALYVPQLRGIHGAASSITLLQLATHTSSLPRATPPAPKGYHTGQQEAIEFLKRWKPSYPIGTHYVYSNLGFGLIGYALANVEHRPYEQVIRQDILQPLGMTSTMIEVPTTLNERYAQGYSPQGIRVPHSAKNALPGGGALRSTANDMLKFLEANLGVGTAEELLSAIHLAEKSYYRVNDKLTMGLGWQKVQLQDLLVIDKNGGLPGFSSYIGMIPDQQIGVVILANQAQVNTTQLGRSLLKRLAAK